MEAATQFACGACGRDVDGDATLCPFCGHEFEPGASLKPDGRPRLDRDWTAEELGRLTRRDLVILATDLAIPPSRTFHTTTEDLLPLVWGTMQNRA